MFDITRDILSLTDFKRNSADYIDQIEKEKSPLILTVNGKAKLVLQDAESYQLLMQTIDQMAAIKGISKGLDDWKQGRVKPANEVFADLN